MTFAHQTTGDGGADMSGADDCDAKINSLVLHSQAQRYDGNE